MTLLGFVIVISGCIVNIINMYRYIRLKRRIVDVYHRSVTIQKNFCDDLTAKVISGQSPSYTVFQLRAMKAELENMEDTLIKLKGNGYKK